MLLDTEYIRTAQNQLEDGEKLLWSGRPTPARAAVGTLVIWLFAVPWTGFAVFLTWWVAVGVRGRWAQPGLTTDFLLPFLGLPFVLFGLVLISAPYWVYANAKRTVYAITNKRVLIIEPVRAGLSYKTQSYTVRSYTAKDIGNVRRTECGSGAGDLAFAQTSYKDRRGHWHSTDIQFTGIPDVNAAESILLSTFKKEETQDHE